MIAFYTSFEYSSLSIFFNILFTSNFYKQISISIVDYSKPEQFYSHWLSIVAWRSATREIKLTYPRITLLCASNFPACITKDLSQYIVFKEGTNLSPPYTRVIFLSIDIFFKRCTNSFCFWCNFNVWVYLFNSFWVFATIEYIWHLYRSKILVSGA